jgi:hypothetical protein
MAETPDHLKVYDPNAPAPSDPPAPYTPPRTPSIVLAEFFRALCKYTGNHPEVEALLVEYEAMTKAPALPPDPEKAPEPEI